jgi:hypothetical protein
MSKYLIYEGTAQNMDEGDRFSDFDASLMSLTDAVKLVDYCRAKAFGEGDADLLGLAGIVIFDHISGSEHDDELRWEAETSRPGESLGEHQDRERNR